ncbi:hypothetical protein D3C87_1988410 [compost metagenome]
MRHIPMISRTGLPVTGRGRLHRTDYFWPLGLGLALGLAAGFAAGFALGAGETWVALGSKPAA